MEGNANTFRSLVSIFVCGSFFALGLNNFFLSFFSSFLFFSPLFLCLSFSLQEIYSITRNWELLFFILLDDEHTQPHKIANFHQTSYFLHSPQPPSIQLPPPSFLKWFLLRSPIILKAPNLKDTVQLSYYLISQQISQQPIILSLKQSFLLSSGTKPF